MKTTTQDIVFSAIKNKAILKSDQQRLISPNGNNNSWLIDMRRIFMDASILEAVAELFWQEFSAMLPFQVGGMETAAIPLLSAILMKSAARGTPVSGFMIRKERKTYGTGSLIEGELSDLPIVIVDDVINSGSSAEKVRVVLEKLGRSIHSMFAMIDYNSPKGIGWRSNHNIPVVAPFSLSDFELSVKKAERKLAAPIFRNVWNLQSPDPNFFHRVPKSFPATDGERVYFGSDSGIFWCLDAATGKILWGNHVESDGHKNIWSAPALNNGKVYFGAYDGNVYCLDGETGAEIWRFSGADWVGSSPALAPEIGLLFIGLEFAVEDKRGSIVALDLDTGEKVWEHKTKRYTHASPAYWKERGLVACGSNDNEMFLFEAITGKLLWRFETRGDGLKGSIRHAPAFDKQRNHVITGAADGFIYIIDISTGKEVWSVKTGGSIYTIPLVIGNKAYLGSTDKNFYILDLDQKLVLHKIYCGSQIFCPPQLLEGKIFFGACNGLIYEVDPETSAVSGTHQLPDAITNTLTYSPKTRMYYALTYVNEIFAMEHL
jgi:outer membrane protein assembly factor BamB/orotate phosphoribosyltransferase